MTAPLEIRCAAALFDMDGTLIDSTAVVEALWVEFCREYDVDPAKLLAFAHGRPTRQTLERFLAGHAPAERESVAVHLESREIETLDGIVEIPGARQLLQTIEAPWAVVTSAPRALAVRRMEAAGPPRVGRAGARRRDLPRQARPLRLPASGRAPRGRAA